MRYASVDKPMTALREYPECVAPARIVSCPHCSTVLQSQDPLGVYAPCIGEWIEHCYVNQRAVLALRASEIALLHADPLHPRAISL